MRDVLVVGEALVDIVQRRDGSTDEHPGGSPANVALGLARLGRTTDLLTRIGDDPRGRSIADRLTGDGVVLVPGSMTGGSTSTAAATLDEQGVASYFFDLDWFLPALPEVAGYRCLHTGSIAAFLAPGGDEVVRMVEGAAGRVTVTYDPNARPMLMGDAASARARVEHLVSLSDVVKVSDEDLEWLSPGEDPEQVAAAWQKSGPAVVVVTMGGDGALAVTPSGTVRIASPKITVVDTVGAGDSFMSALIDHLAGAGLLGGENRDALRRLDAAATTGLLTHAARVAAITCGRAGANPPTRAELDSLTPLP